MVAIILLLLPINFALMLIFPKVFGWWNVVVNLFLFFAIILTGFFMLLLVFYFYAKIKEMMPE